MAHGAINGKSIITIWKIEACASDWIVPHSIDGTEFGISADKMSKLSI
jgi:hypothetical protein